MFIHSQSQTLQLQLIMEVFLSWKTGSNIYLTVNLIMHVLSSFIRYALNKSTPFYDTTQSFTDPATNRMDGVLSFAFTRLIHSTDTSGQDANLKACQYVIWAFRGTVRLTNPATVGHHGTAVDRRDVSSNQICLQQCDRESGKCINYLMVFSSLY